MTTAKGPLEPTDRWLRSFGFVIASRPPKGPALWRRQENGRWRFYSQAEALAWARAEVKAVEKRR